MKQSRHLLGTTYYHTANPFPVMKTGFSLWGNSHREKPVFITGNPVLIAGILFSSQGFPCEDPVLPCMGLQCKYSSLHVGSWYTIKSVQYLNFMLYIQTRVSNESIFLFLGHKNILYLNQIFRINWQAQNPQSGWDFESLYFRKYRIIASFNYHFAAMRRTLFTVFKS